jgi:hypothetical protein
MRNLNIFESNSPETCGIVWTDGVVSKKTWIWRPADRRANATITTRVGDTFGLLLQMRQRATPDDGQHFREGSVVECGHWTPSTVRERGEQRRRR